MTIAAWSVPDVALVVAVLLAACVVVALCAAAPWGSKGKPKVRAPGGRSWK